MRVLMISALFGLLTFASASAQSPVDGEIAPNGQLRVAMLGANPVLVSKDANGTFGGISFELGAFIAERLGATMKPIIYSDPAAYAASFGKGEWDIAIGPRRASEIDKVSFSPDFMLVDGQYVAAPGRDFADGSQVDRAGIKIAVARNGNPDAVLSGALKAATLVRVRGLVEDAVEILRSHQADVYAGNGQIVYSVAEKLPGSKIISGAFTSAPFAVLLPIGRSEAARSRIKDIVLEAIVTDLPRKAIERQGLRGVRQAAK